ncbi:adenine deaminase [Paenibacillus alvei]|uniref:adenine deaminase n=1 Tax=Paenibacillus alvei TaxID=44250 RepID=UPI00227DCCD6|nr:adenine deaminase [Paenibacillus alvei]MCY7484068.1 adenine deaminase [Paenibacillus alvei]
MNWSKQHWINRIAAAGRRKPADLVITNGKIVDVFNLEIMEGDIAIVDGMIVGIGGSYEGERVIDAEGRYIAPSFIDTHVHIESAMVTPAEFARVVLPHGVTTVITDPHEIANVVGTAGIQYMLDASENLPLDVYIMLPSCVPCTPFEHAGAKLDAGSLEPFYAHPRVLGLAEVMDYPSVRRGDDMVDKLLSSHRNGRMIDGHGAGLDEEAINVYRAVGIRNDHECVTAEEARVRLRRGMYVMLREGSVAKDVEALIPAVTASNARRCVFCTDDKHLDELLHEGSVDHNARLAIRCGLDPLQAIQMASLNAAECFGLHTKGAIAPGYEADFLLLDNLHDLTIAQVYKAGNRVGDNGQYTGPQLHSAVIPSQLMKTVHLPDITERDLQIELGNQERHCHIIGINPNSLITTHLVEAVDIENGYFRSSVEKDQLKIAVFERHHHTGCVGLGIVKGFGIQSGAIASTVAHDSHNLVVAGSNDRDMLTAIQALRQMEGGLVVTSGGKVLAAIELPLAGLMAINGYTKVLEDMEQLNEALARIGASQEFNPFVTLSFLCLPVIPELKLTDMGLFDFSSFTHIPVSAK